MKRTGNRLTTEEISGKVYVTPQEASRILPYDYKFWCKLFDTEEVDGYREPGAKGKRLLLLASCKDWLLANREHNHERAKVSDGDGRSAKENLRDLRKRHRELERSAGARA